MIYLVAPGASPRLVLGSLVGWCCCRLISRFGGARENMRWWKPVVRLPPKNRWRRYCRWSRNLYYGYMYIYIWECIYLCIYIYNIDFEEYIRRNQMEFECYRNSAICLISFFLSLATFHHVTRWTGAMTYMEQWRDWQGVLCHYMNGEFFEGSHDISKVIDQPNHIQDDIQLLNKVHLNWP